MWAFSALRTSTLLHPSHVSIIPKLSLRLTPNPIERLANTSLSCADSCGLFEQDSPACIRDPTKAEDWCLWGVCTSCGMVNATAKLRVPRENAFMDTTVASKYWGYFGQCCEVNDAVARMLVKFTDWAVRDLEDEGEKKKPTVETTVIFYVIAAHNDMSRDELVDKACWSGLAGNKATETLKRESTPIEPVKKALWHNTVPLGSLWANAIFLYSSGGIDLQAAAVTAKCAQCQNELEDQEKTYKLAWDERRHRYWYMRVDDIWVTPQQRVRLGVSKKQQKHKELKQTHM
ncbi:uncharacterized protein BJ212DRAFT_1300271 [Suillus subaureus]|uniref:Uncharacterized protein n=1 Tax=Suillus subaureus TaxID=48587 RepID=A0A9P7JCF4_9AGAM|nr:uncharacterized protein BJ212DRAFT_1300271 [Suillus subaureus]KAG1815079.1 hypothetical protein BJ212DRAFT_1300271 [Suillus subaureus]